MGVVSGSGHEVGLADEAAVAGDVAAVSVAAVLAEDSEDGDFQQLEGELEQRFAERWSWMTTTTGT